MCQRNFRTWWIRGHVGDGHGHVPYVAQNNDAAGISYLENIDCCEGRG